MDHETNPTFLSHISEVIPLTLLVGDLRGFSRLSREVPEEVLASVINDWSAECRRIIAAHGGHLDKFIGDSVFAWWRGREDDTRHQALQAARALASCVRSPEGRGDLEFQCGIGLHCGKAALTRQGGSHTVIGPDVNLVFRLESLTRPLGAGIIASHDFAHDWTGLSPEFHGHGPQKVKGWVDPVEVFSPLG